MNRQSKYTIYEVDKKYLVLSRRAPLNAKRANVVPANKGSKVNNIALRMATLVLRFS